MRSSLIGNIKDIVYNWFPLKEQTEISINEQTDTDANYYVYNVNQGEETLTPYCDEEIKIPKINVIKQTSGDEEVSASYIITEAGSQVGATIEIAKNYFITSATVETCTIQGVPVEDYEIGDKYIDFVLNTSEGDDKHLYIKLDDFATQYSADETTLHLNENNSFSIKQNYLHQVATSGNYNHLSNKPTPVTKVSDLSNDVGYVTSDYHDSTKQNISTLDNAISIRGYLKQEDVELIVEDMIKSIFTGRIANVIVENGELTVNNYDEEDLEPQTEGEL